MNFIDVKTYKRDEKGNETTIIATMTKGWTLEMAKELMHESVTKENDVYRAEVLVGGKVVAFEDKT